MEKEKNIKGERTEHRALRDMAAAGGRSTNKGDKEVTT